MKWLDGITNSMDMSLSKLRDSEGQQSLVFCSPCGRKESDTTERLNNNSNQYSAVLAKKSRQINGTK